MTDTTAYIYLHPLESGATEAYQWGVLLEGFEHIVGWPQTIDYGKAGNPSVSRALYPYERWRLTLGVPVTAPDDEWGTLAALKGYFDLDAPLYFRPPEADPEDAPFLAYLMGELRERDLGDFTLEEGGPYAMYQLAIEVRKAQVAGEAPAGAATNEEALENPVRRPVAALVHRPARQQIGARIYGSGTLVDIDTGDIGRAVASSVSVLRVRHTGTGIYREFWDGAPGTGTPNTGITTPAATYAKQSLGLTLYERHFYVAHAISATEFSIYRHVDDVPGLNAFGSARALPATIPADGWVSFAFPGGRHHRYLFCAIITPARCRIWAGVFTSNDGVASSTSPLNWTEIPYPLYARPNEDEYALNPEVEAFGWPACNGFDAIDAEQSPTGTRIAVLCQDHGLGRSILIPYDTGGTWGDPSYPVPIDLVSEHENVRLCRMSYAGGTDGGFMLTGRITRADSWRERNDTAQATAWSADFCLRSWDAFNWSIQEDSYIQNGPAEWGQMVVYEDQYFYVAAGSIRAGPPPTSVTSYPYTINVNRGARSMPTADVTVDAEGTAPSEHDCVSIQMGYDSLDNLVVVGEFRMDRLETTEGGGDIRKSGRLRDLSGQRLADWTAAYGYELQGQLKVLADFTAPDEATVTIGEPITTVMEAFVITNQLETAPDVWEENVSIDVGEVFRIWIPDDGRPDDRGPLIVGQELRQRDADNAISLRARVEKYIGRDGVGIIYDCALLQAPGGSATIPDDQYFTSDEIFLGRPQAKDEIMVSTPRRMFGQFCEATLRFSPYDWQHGEVIQCQIHRADGSNAFTFSLFKEDNGAGGTALRWNFGVMVAERFIQLDTDRLIVTMDPLDATIYVRWRYQNGRIVVEAGDTAGVYDAPVVDYAVDGLLVAREGGVGFMGILRPIYGVLTHDFTANDEAYPLNFLAVSDTAPAGGRPGWTDLADWPASGWVLINGYEREYVSRNGTPVEEHNVTNAGFGNAWHFSDFGITPPTYLIGTVARIVQYNDAAPPNNFTTHFRSVSAVGYTAPSGGFDNGVWIDFDDGRPFWLNEQNTLDNQVAITFYPALRLASVDEDNPRYLDIGEVPAGAEFQLIASPYERPAQVAVDSVEIADSTPDYSLSEAVKIISQTAGARLDPDTLPQSAWEPWTLGTGASRLYANEASAGYAAQNLLTVATTATGTAISGLIITDAVMRFRTSPGSSYSELRLDLADTSEGFSVRLYNDRVEFVHRAVGETLLSRVPYYQGTLSASPTAFRVCIEGPYISVWVGDAFAATFRDTRLNGARKQVGFGSGNDRQIVGIEVWEAYEPIEPFTVERGDKGLAAINRLIGRRRLGLLFRSPDPVRFGTLTQRTDLGALLGVEYKRTEEVSSTEPLTEVTVQGNNVSVSRFSEPDTWGWRSQPFQNPDISTRDAAEREAQAILRHSQEQARSYASQRDADLRAVNEAECEIDGEAFVVNSSSFSFSASENSISLRQALGLRLKVEG